MNCCLLGRHDRPCAICMHKGQSSSKTAGHNSLAAAFRGAVNAQQARRALKHLRPVGHDNVLRRRHLRRRRRRCYCCCRCCRGTPGSPPFSPGGCPAASPRGSRNWRRNSPRRGGSIAESQMRCLRGSCIPSGSDCWSAFHPNTRKEPASTESSSSLNEYHKNVYKHHNFFLA